MRALLLVFLFGASSYLALCVCAFFLQKRLTFFPARRLVATPSDAALEYEDVRVPTSDGVTLHGWFVPRADASSVVLFFHGNAGNISQRLHTLRFWHDLGLSIFAFDYRGYGQSEGEISEVGTQRDARAVWAYLTERRGYAPESIVILGRSLGAAVAIELASAVPCAGLVAESAFTTVADMAGRAYPWLPVRVLLRMRFDSRRHVRTIAVPKLFVHSTDDETVPFDMGRALHDAAREPKQFLAIRGAHHDGWFRSGDLYANGVRLFLGSLGLH